MPQWDTNTHTQLTHAHSNTMENQGWWMEGCAAHYWRQTNKQHVSALITDIPWCGVCLCVCPSISLLHEVVSVFHYAQTISICLLSHRRHGYDSCSSNGLAVKQQSESTSPSQQNRQNNPIPLFRCFYKRLPSVLMNHSESYILYGGRRINTACSIWYFSGRHFQKHAFSFSKKSNGSVFPSYSTASKKKL